MMQPDLFFAYGMSAGLAAAARVQFRSEARPWATKYFAGAMLWMGLFYVPQLLYLLFRFPGWETMFVVRDLSGLPAGLVGLYFAAVMALAAAGFGATWWFLRRGRLAVALAQAGAGMLAGVLMIFVGWDGAGWRRLLYAGSGSDWAQGVVYPYTDFFHVIFPTLLWLEAIVLAPYCSMLFRWRLEGWAVERKT
jgi:hypothetical protein